MNVFYKTILNKTLVAVAILAVIICCNRQKENKKTTALIPPKPIEKLYGNWLCSDLLDSINARKNMTDIFESLSLPYAYEIQFDKSFNDSVLIYNGFEQFFLPVTISNDSVILNDAIQGSPLIMIYDSVSATLKIMITRKDNYPLPSLFFKADEKYIQPNGRFAEAFPSAFNEATVEGDYILLNNQQTTATKITFNKDGTLSGYARGYRYQCCTGGDCFEMMEEPMNTLSIIMEDEAPEDWGWKLSSNTDTLTLIKVKAANPDEPGTYKPTAVILKLVRNK